MKPTHVPQTPRRPETRGVETIGGSDCATGYRRTKNRATLRAVRWRWISLFALFCPVAAQADGPSPVTVLTRTLSYEEGLAARLTGEPLAVFSFGFDCATWPPDARIAGHATRCQVGDDRTSVADASKGAGVLVLGLIDRPLALELIGRARNALVPVLGLGAEHAAPEVLLTVEGTRTFVGEEALRLLGARFPVAVLRLATIVSGDVMPPPLPEDAEPPTPEPGNVAPPYPEQARARGIEGLVVLRVGVSTRGAVQAVQVVKGDEPLASAAAAAVRQWRYTPASSDGRPVATSLIVKVPFRLSSNGRSFTE
jgi:TonB family protein